MIYRHFGIPNVNRTMESVLENDFKSMNVATTFYLYKLKNEHANGILSFCFWITNKLKYTRYDKT